MRGIATLILCCVVVFAVAAPVFAGGTQEGETAAEEGRVAVRTGEYGEAPMLAELVQQGEFRR